MEQKRYILPNGHVVNAIHKDGQITVPNGSVGRPVQRKDVHGRTITKHFMADKKVDRRADEEYARQAIAKGVHKPYSPAVNESLVDSIKSKIKLF